MLGNILSKAVGFISIVGDCEALIANSLFYNISSATGSVFYAKFVSSFSINIRKNLIINSSSENSMEMFFFQECSKIFFCNNVLKSNKNTIFTIIQAIVVFSGNLYEDIGCWLSQFGCILQSTLNSSIKIEKETYYKITSLSNFIFDISNTRINIYSSNLQMIQTSKNVGYIFHSITSHLNLFNISMINFFPGGVKCDQGSYFFVNQSFFMKNSSKNMLFNQNEGSVIATYNILYFSIMKSYFVSNYYSKKGGAVFLRCDNDFGLNISNYEIQFSVFTDNKNNEIGGVIYCENSNLILTSNAFVNNSASQVGGVIYFNGTFKLILKNNSFIDNFGWEGGAIKYTDTLPIVENDNIFLNNTAYYGPDFASYPIRFSIIEYLNQLNESQLFMNGKPSNLVPVFQNFSINLLDILNQTVVTINNSYIFIDLLSSNLSLYFSIKGETRIPILKGRVFINQTFFSSNLSNAILNFQITTNAIQVYENEDLKLSQNEKIVNNQYILNIPLKIQNCSLGEYFDKNLFFCIPCPRGTFSLVLYVEKCELCPNEADFCADSRIFLQNGYWRSNNFSQRIYKCLPISESCRGGFDSACEIGYTGPLCQSCERGANSYTKAYGNKCFICLNNYSLQIFQLVLGGVALIAFYIYILRGNLKLNETFKFDKAGNLSQQCHDDFYSTIYNKIIVDYFQMISFVKGLDLNWTEIVSIFFQIDYYVGNAPGYIFSFDCLIQDSFSIKPLYLQMILFSSLPFISIFLIWCFWFWRLKKSYHQNIQLFWQKYTTSELVLLNILQPTIVNAMMKILTCREIDGTYYILNNYNYECRNEENTWYIFAISLPSLFVWGVMYQILNLSRILRYRKALDAENVRTRIGFLYNFYRKKYYYWEFVEIYKKYIIIFIITYWQVNPEIKSLIVLFLIYLLCVLLNRFKPFITQEINNLSFFAHMVVIATLIFGLFSFETNEDVQIFANYFIFTINFLFLLIFYLKFVLVKKNRIKSYFNRMRFFKNTLFSKIFTKRTDKIMWTDRKIYNTQK